MSFNFFLYSTSHYRIIESVTAFQCYVIMLFEKLLNFTFSFECDDKVMVNFYWDNGSCEEVFIMDFNLLIKMCFLLDLLNCHKECLNLFKYLRIHYSLDLIKIQNHGQDDVNFSIIRINPITAFD